MNTLDCDPRPVSAIFGPGEAGCAFTTQAFNKGAANCHRIVAYSEISGNGTCVWFAVYDERDEIKARVNSAFVEQVRYDTR